MQTDPWWLGKKGEWYVVIQFILFAVIVFGPRNPDGAPPWGGSVSVYGPWAGATLVVAGGLFSLWGMTALGRNLSPLPHPLDQAEFVKAGPYNFVRHPIYSGIILAAFGWSLFVQGTLTMIYAVVLFLFFDMKTRREERFLTKKFPEYSEYGRQVRKLIPFVY